MQVELADADLLNLAAAKVRESLDVCWVDAVQVQPNVAVHRAAANDIDFRSRAARAFGAMVCSTCGSSGLVDRLSALEHHQASVIEGCPLFAFGKWLGSDHVSPLRW